MNLLRLFGLKLAVSLAGWLLQYVYRHSIAMREPEINRELPNTDVLDLLCYQPTAFDQRMADYVEQYGITVLLVGDRGCGVSAPKDGRC
jgi:hypothetical protein